MNAQTAQPSGTVGLAPVGDSNPGTRPSKLEIKMKNPRATRNGVNPSLWWPIISWLCPSMNPCIPSKMCCIAPGRSTDKLERTSRNTISRTANTTTSMATALVMGAWGYFGSICRARSKAVTGPAQAWFRSCVNQSCSGMNQYQLLFLGMLTIHVLRPRTTRNRLRTRWPLRAGTGPSEARRDSREKHSI